MLEPKHDGIGSASRSRPRRSVVRGRAPAHDVGNVRQLPKLVREAMLALPDCTVDGELLVTVAESSDVARLTRRRSAA